LLAVDSTLKIPVAHEVGAQHLGIVNVQWVCPTSSITSSASKAPKAAPRFAEQDGHRTRAAPRS